MMNFIRRFKLWQRFVMLGVLGCALFATPMTLYVIEANKMIELTQLQHHGMPALTASLHVMQDLQKHRGLSAGVLAGKKQMAEDRLKIQGDAQKALKAMSDAMRTANADAKLLQAVDKITAELNAISAAVSGGSISAQDSLARHNAMLDEQLHLIENLADFYGLTLDPEAHIYHLAIAAYVRAPLAAEIAGRARAMGVTALESGKIGAETHAVLNEVNAQLLGATGRVVSTINKSLAIEPSLKAQLGDIDANLGAKSRLAVDTVSNRVLSNAAGKMESAEFFRIMTGAIDSQFDMMVKISQLIDDQLDVREARLSMTEWTVIGVSALLVLLAVVIGLIITRSITHPVDRAIALAEDIAKGELGREFNEDFTDEVGRLSHAMARMQGVLKSLVAAQERMKQEHDSGAISHRIDTKPFSGSYREMAEGVNELVSAHIAVKMNVVEIVSEYAKGNLSVDIDRLPGEKAKITEAIDAVKHSLQSVNGELGKLVAAASMGDFSQRGDAARYEYDFREMVEGLNRLMEAADSGLTVVAGVLNKVAEGDLTQRVEGDLRGQFAQLQSDTNKTVEQLARVIGQIREGADTINLASKEIAQGNNDLSQRTEEQASSLEETASSMEELTATVRQNAENSRQANQLAAGASEVAVKGGDMVRQVVETMGGITESSKKIADIISVIDGIAFQTNILALNAAVEAARAGEQGRGFAVVATEVRNLAQRSANAAKEIKQLISDSVNTVEAGSKLVNEAGATMDEIVSSVKRVTDIMAEITAASQEQSGGIEQVNQAVTQMDEVTQQNAALVEQAAAAAESLQEQAGTLVQAVSVFKVAANDAGARSWDGQAERRSPDRAKNVARIPHAKPAAKPVAKSSAAAPGKKAVGDDSAWQEF